MSASRSEYQIAIKTTADTTAAKETEDSLKRVGETAKSNTHQSEADLEIKKTLDQATGKLGDTSEEAGKKEHNATERTTLDHREKREALRAVLNEFGGFSEVGLLMQPELAALAATLALVDGIKKAFENLQAPVEAFRAALAAIDEAKLKSAAESAADLSHTLSELADEESRLTAAYNSGNAAISARIEKYNEERDAVIKVEEAKIHAYEEEVKLQAKLGTITQEHADALIDSAHLALESDRAASDAAKLRNEIDQKALEYSNARLRVRAGIDTRAVADAKAGEAGPNAAQAAAETNLENISKGPVDVEGKSYKDLAELKKAAQEAKDKITDLQTQANTPEFQLPGGQAVIQERIRIIQAESAAMDEAIRSREQYIKNLQKEAEAAKEANEHAKNKTAIATEQLKKDEDLNRTGADTIRALQEKLALMERTAAAVQEANTQAAHSRQAAAAASTPAAHADATARAQVTAEDANIQADARGERGMQANADAAETVATAKIFELQFRSVLHPDAAALAQIHKIHQRIIGYMENHLGVTEGTHAALSAIDQRLSVIESRQSDMHTMVSNHESRSSQSANVW